ncbi:hypothetical protein HD806DRAFT_516901 [Xylariaceae sp. AK1471]|nr:hypothetical protein HD806DRAFT_516901 [Xylariaceae sp. AK1471]
MNELHDHTDVATQLDSTWENQWNESMSDQSSVALTPPSTGSVGEPTPASPDLTYDDGVSGTIEHQGENENWSSNINASKVKLASAIEVVVSSLTNTTSPLTRQQAWASIQALAEDNIAKIVEKETRRQDVHIPSSKALKSLRNDMEGFPALRNPCLDSQRTSNSSHESSSRDGREVYSTLRHNDNIATGQSLLNHRLNISLQMASESSSQVPLSRQCGRVNKRRSLSARPHLPSANGSVQLMPGLPDSISELIRVYSDGPNLRRGRPSARGFSCSHCAIAKKKCTGNDNCCDACLKSPIYRQLCIKADFKGSRLLLHDLYKTRITALHNNVMEYTWEDPNVEPMAVTISNGFDSQLEIELRHYVPLNEDALTHTIFRGLEAGMTVPTAKSTPFALREGTLTSEKIDRYCDGLAYDMVFREARESIQNTLLNHVILFAVAQIRHEDVRTRIEGLETVRLALRFWAIQAIFFTYPWRIERGGHLIGMFPLQLPGYWNGITLLPRLVNQELDRAFEARMDEIEKETLEKLQLAIFKRHRDYWCSIFLSSFILLHSLERDTWNMSAWKYETSSRGAASWPLRKSPSDYCDQNKYIADVLATHFRVVNQGCSPLKQNWNKPLNQQLLSNSVPARRFISSIQCDFNSPTSNYEAELRRSREFARSNAQSLNYIYTKMLFKE